MNDQDRVLQAFRRLLKDAGGGGQAKVDALVALAQRTVWVSTWGAGNEGFRTLTNSDGHTALPVFTDPATLGEAGQRYGWQAPDGQTPGKEVGAREALRYAIAHSLNYVVVDIGSDHALDVERSEIEPLLTPQGRREVSGPYAGVGRISSTMMRAVKPTPRPGSVEAPSLPDPIPPPTSTPNPMPPARPNPPTPGIRATTESDPNAIARSGAVTFGSGTSSRIGPLSAPPSDALLDALTAVLRDYPEVEWAALGNASRGPTAPVPTVALRIDTSYRARVNDIVTAVREAGDAQGASLDALLLDDPELMRAARESAFVFYPWRR